MEQPEPNKATIRGKDLVGGIKVMPMGLDAAIKKRTSGEFKSEQRGGTLSFSNAGANQQAKMESFKEETSGFNQVSSFKSSSQQSSSAMKSSSMQSSSMQSSSMQSSSFQSSSSKQMSSTSQMSSSSAMSMSSQKSMSSMTSSKSIASSGSNSVSFNQDVQQSSDFAGKSLVHNQEIEQEGLKTQLVSAITDLEGDREFVDFGRDNKPIDLTSPPQTYSPPPKSAFTPTKQDPFSPSKQDMFSPPPLEPMEPPKPQPQPVLPSLPSEPAAPPAVAAPARNEILNGFSEFSSTSQNLEVQTIQESSQTHTQQFQMNGTHEESSSLQGSSSSSSLLQKIMTPAPVEYDTGSLKRRDPRKMFTDSSFYNAAHHPTVADQVEMAHRLSSAMFNEKNSSSKGQKMYLTRLQNSGGMHDADYQSRHDAVPNMKLVMNPEGKVHEWDDLPEDQKPDYQQIAVHAAPNVPLPDTADPVAESLNAGVGKGGELFAKRKKRAENWVVDENSIGQAKPSAFADKFMQEQTQQQAAFQQQQLLEQQQKEIFAQQQLAKQQSELLQQQQQSKQTFVQQQQIKQEQSLEIRRQQEEQARMAQQQIDFPENFQHTSLKARSFTPSLDLGVHNVQGINVWANTAPRGWSTSYQRTKATPPKANPPTVSVCPATPSVDNELMQQRMQETKIAEQEEQIRIQQQQQEQIKIQEEQIRMQQQQEEQMMIQRQQEEQMRIQQQQEEQMRIKQQQEEQLKIQQQQAEQMRIQQQQEEQLRIQMQQEEERRYKEEQLRIQQQEEQLRIQQQQEEQMRIQQQQEEQARIQRQQEEQMRIQQQQEEQRRIQLQQEEQRRIQQQQEEQMRIQREQEEQARQAAEMKRQQEEAERQRQEQIQRQEMERQQQEMMLQQQSQRVSSSQISSSSSTARSGGFAAESRPEPLLSESQLAKPPMSSSLSLESSQSQSFAQQSSHIQQSSSSSFQSKTTQEVYESQEFSGGVMKGYRMKQEQNAEQRETGEKMLNTGVFGGIGGDNNSLVDAEFDYKKHSVKDLAKHFALVKPKADIPHTILPEQRIYNGDQGPALNYLGSAKGEMGSTSSTHSFTKKEVSQEDFEASKLAYENKKKQQQMESQKSQSTVSSQSTVVKRSETEQNKSVVNERRQSLTASLILDPATAHAESGIIDPSAILRGETATQWKQSDPSPQKISLRATSTSPSSQMYISRPSGPRTFAPVKFNTLPRKSHAQSSLPPLPTKTTHNESSNHQKQSQSHHLDTSINSTPKPMNSQSPAPLIQKPSTPTLSHTPQQQRLTQSSPKPTHQKSFVTPASSDVTSYPTSKPFHLTQRPASTPINQGPYVENRFSESQRNLQSESLLSSTNISQFKNKAFDSFLPSKPNSVITEKETTDPSNSLTTPSLAPDTEQEYQCTVQTTSKQYAPTPTPMILLDQSSLDPVSTTPITNLETETAPRRPVSQTNTHIQPVQKTSVIQTMLKNTSGLNELGLDEMAVSLSFPEVSRSSNVTPAPTTPFPSLDTHSSLNIPPSPIPATRPKTPILVTTRPSSVSLDRTRHVSKEDLARMMAELNAPLPPMQQIPQEIRASPLIFSGGPAAVSHSTSLSMSQTTSSSFTMSSATSQTLQ